MVTSSWSRVKPATASVMRKRSGWPLLRSQRSMLEGGEPSAPLTTRSSTRSISSNPSRNGLDNEGTRDISKPSRSDFEGPLRRPIFGRPADCHPVNKQYGYDLVVVQAPVDTREKPWDVGSTR